MILLGWLILALIGLFFVVRHLGLGRERVEQQTTLEVAATEQRPTEIIARNPPPVDLATLPPDIARQIAALPHRTMGELQDQWLYAIRMVVRASPPNAAAFRILRDALITEWGRRARVASRRPGHFPWPCTTAKSGSGLLDGSQWHVTGILSYLGYRVGRTNGEPAGVRRQILDLCFEQELPPINGPAYMSEWGPSGTTTRLKKLANDIAAFARNGKRKRSADLTSAVEDWEADLKYLYDRYYHGHFKFSWPRLE